MIILKIVFWFFLWTIAGLFTQWLMFIRRKLTGLPVDKIFNPIKGKYVAIQNRTKPDENDITGLAVTIFGFISLVLWIIVSFIILFIPLFIYLIGNFYIIVFNKIFKLNNELLDLDEFINCDLGDDDDY